MKKICLGFLSLFVLFIGLSNQWFIKAEDQYDVSFRATFKNRIGGDTIAYYEPGDTIYVDFDQVTRVDIVPLFNGATEPADSGKAGDIFYWTRWVDSTGVRPDEYDKTHGNDDLDFKFGDKIQTIGVRDSEGTRTQANDEYYYIQIEAKEIGSDNRPSYGWDTLVSSYNGNQYRIYVEEIDSPENLAYVYASDYDYYFTKYPERYEMHNLYDSADDLINHYLFAVFGERTTVESDNWKTEELPIHWKLKDNSVYNPDPLATNTFVWWIDKVDFGNLGWTNTNNVALSGELTITNPAQVDQPIISPLGGAYSTDFIHVTMFSNEDGATIYYTIDGTIPTSTSTKYESGFDVPVGTTIKAFAVKDGMVDSEITTVTYTKKYPETTPQPPEDDSVDQPSQSCAGFQDKNCDGVVTCDEVNGPGWVWSEAEKACVVNTVVEPTQTNSIYHFVNTNDR